MNGFTREAESLIALQPFMAEDVSPVTRTAFNGRPKLWRNMGILELLIDEQDATGLVHVDQGIGEDSRTLRTRRRRENTHLSHRSTYFPQ